MKINKELGGVANKALITPIPMIFTVLVKLLYTFKSCMTNITLVFGMKALMNMLWMLLTANVILPAIWPGNFISSKVALVLVGDFGVDLGGDGRQLFFQPQKYLLNL